MNLEEFVLEIEEREAVHTRNEWSYTEGCNKLLLKNL